MDGITEIFKEGRSADQIISDLQNKQIDIPSWNILLQDYEPALHPIVTDHSLRKDKVRKDGVVEKASRIHLGLEKLLCKRMTEFAMAIPVKRIYHNTEGNETRQSIAKAIEAIYKYARIDSENIRRWHDYFASCEILTIWYTVEQPNSLYGFNSKFKLKCKTFSPMMGVKLYPLFDEMGDLLAMSVQWKHSHMDFTTIYFETFTANRHYKWVNKGGSWQQAQEPKAIRLLKIPGIYAYRHQPIYHGLSHIRNEIEFTLSRNSDVIAYNAAPVLKVAGEVQGYEDKGESQRVYRVENGGDVGYVSWGQSIEALRYHVELLFNQFWTLSQMPDISFANMKSLGNIGFDARQTLLTDAHLKVGDESGAIIEFLERESNVVKAFLKEMNQSWASEIDNIEVEHVIKPFVQNDEKLEIDKLINATGGKAIMSQLEGIKAFGMSSDPQETLKQIQAEQSASAMSDVFESAL